MPSVYKAAERGELRARGPPQEAHWSCGLGHPQPCPPQATALGGWGPACGVCTHARARQQARSFLVLLVTQPHGLQLQTVSSETDLCTPHSGSKNEVIFTLLIY